MARKRYKSPIMFDAPAPLETEAETTIYIEHASELPGSDEWEEGDYSGPDGKPDGVIDMYDYDYWLNNIFPKPEETDPTSEGGDIIIGGD